MTDILRKYPHLATPESDNKPLGLCPSCGASWATLRECLQETPQWETNGMGGRVLIESPNHATARIIIGNCPECKKEFGG